MANWFHRFLNPHCSECKEEAESKFYCSGCETLRTEVARLRHDNERLLNRILEKPTEDTRETAPKPTTELKPKHIPWAVRRQFLEKEDREKAKIMAQVPKSDASIEELEKELDVVSAEREAEGTHGA